MERALLEGEHQMEMEELEHEQHTINSLKTRQLELIDQAQAQRDKVNVMSCKLGGNCMAKIHSNF